MMDTMIYQEFKPPKALSPFAMRGNHMKSDVVFLQDE
jgi:hypothetical protein